MPAQDEVGVPDRGGFGPEVELFFDDFRPGQHFELGDHLISETEMLAFARQFDPQPFHVDPERASTTIYRGLIASGWHTAAVWMRLYCDHLLLRTASLGSPGLEELRWLAPVRPGDVLRASARVVSARPSTRHPERGTLVVKGELRDGAGEVKMRLTVWGLLARRLPGGD